MPIYFLVLLCAFSAFADLERINIKNLDLNYVSPHGTGVVEKISIGLTTNKADRYPLEIHRTDGSFQIITPFVDFEWLNPMVFVHEAQTVTAKGVDFGLARGEQFLKGDELDFQSGKGDGFAFKNLDIVCSGPSVDHDPLVRAMKDCRENLVGTIKSMELPFDLKDLPDVVTTVPEEMPANDFSIKIKEGKLFSQIKVKYIIPAYLKVWGYVQFEEEGKVLALRVDQAKFGIVPVRNIVMNELRRRVTNPDITITPPWIRIKIAH